MSNLRLSTILTRNQSTIMNRSVADAVNKMNDAIHQVLLREHNIDLLKHCVESINSYDGFITYPVELVKTQPISLLLDRFYMPEKEEALNPWKFTFDRADTEPGIRFISNADGYEELRFTEESMIDLIERAHTFWPAFAFKGRAALATDSRFNAPSLSDSRNGNETSASQGGEALRPVAGLTPAAIGNLNGVAFNDARDREALQAKHSSAEYAAVCLIWLGIVTSYADRVNMPFTFLDDTHGPIFLARGAWQHLIRFNKIGEAMYQEAAMSPGEKRARAAEKQVQAVKDFRAKKRAEKEELLNQQEREYIREQEIEAIRKRLPERGIFIVSGYDELVASLIQSGRYTVDDILNGKPSLIESGKWDEFAEESYMPELKLEGEGEQPITATSMLGLTPTQIERRIKKRNKEALNEVFNKSLNQFIPSDRHKQAAAATAIDSTDVIEVKVPPAAPDTSSGEANESFDASAMLEEMLSAPDDQLKPNGES